MTAMREIRILKRISHPNVIKLREMAIKRGTTPTDGGDMNES